MSIWKKLFGNKAETNTPTEYNFEASESKGRIIEDFSNLDADSRLIQIMTLGDSANLKYFALMKFAILSDADIGVKFAALKRIHLFKAHPDLRQMLIEMQQNKTGENLEPYFSMALSRLEIISVEEFKNKLNKQSE